MLGRTHSVRDLKRGKKHSSGVNRSIFCSSVSALKEVRKVTASCPSLISNQLVEIRQKQSHLLAYTFIQCLLKHLLLAANLFGALRAFIGSSV